MRNDRVSAIIQKVYAKKYNLAPHYEVVPLGQPLMTRIQPVVQTIQKRRFQILALILVAAISSFIIYYYNILAMNQNNAETYVAHVAALEQRRHDLSLKLTKMVSEYSRYERSLLTAVVALRSLPSEHGVKSPEMEELIEKYKLPEMPAPGTGRDKPAGMLPASALDRLLAVAEQYPDLKLAANYQTLMAAMVAVEKDLSEQRIKMNDMINVFTTTLSQFPSKWIGRLFGFTAPPLFEATEEAKHFSPKKYDERIDLLEKQ